MTNTSTKPLLARLRHLFSPSLIRLGADGPRLLRAGGASARQFLVGRELCLFLHVDSRTVPAGQRAAFMALEVRRAAPFSDPEYDVAWFGDHAAVWYWSRERVRDLLAEPAAQARFASEARMRGQAVETDGAHAQLLALEPVQAEEQAQAEAQTDSPSAPAGFEARLWRQGHIAASRWWPQPPSPDQWHAFLRGGGMDPSLPVPAAEPALLLDRPLGGTRAGQALFGQLRTQLAPLAVAAGALVLAMLAWPLLSALRISTEISAVEREVAPLEQQLETIIDARNRADDAAARIDAMLALRPTASQTRLLAEVQSITQDGDWAVTGWHQPGPELLEVTLRGSGIDTAAVVAAWEQSPLLHDVTPTTGTRPDEQVLQARLTRVGEQAP